MKWLAGVFFVATLSISWFAYQLYDSSKAQSQFYDMEVSELAVREAVLSQAISTLCPDLDIFEEAAEKLGFETKTAEDFGRTADEAKAFPTVVYVPDPAEQTIFTVPTAPQRTYLRFDEEGCLKVQSANLREGFSRLGNSMRFLYYHADDKAFFPLDDPNSPNWARRNHEQ